MRDQRVLDVYLDCDWTTGPTKVGTLFGESNQVRFRYDDTWARSPNARALDPNLELGAGDFYPDTQHGNFGVFLDSSPDRWGQTLLKRREVLMARKAGRPPRTLYAWDFLVGVQDLTRMGALRFRVPGNEVFLDNHPLPAPPVTELRTLAAIAGQLGSRKKLDDLDELSRWLSVLVAPGASLGGARPKASFQTPQEELWIAKFPSADDETDVGLMEKVTHDMAGDAGIRVPKAEVLQLNNAHHTFCVQRFDRVDGARRFMMSAMTATRGAVEQEGSYLDILDVINTRGDASTIQEDREQLFRRVVFNILTGHRDDHLRNHAFIMTPAGLTLSPAYDINPRSDKQHHVLTIDGESADPHIDVAMESAAYYDLPAGRSSGILAEVASVVATWRDRAKAAGVPRADIELAAPAFSAHAGMNAHRESESLTMR